MQSNYTLAEQHAVKELSTLIQDYGITTFTTRWMMLKYPELILNTSNYVLIASRLARIQYAHKYITKIWQDVYNDILAVKLKNGDMMFYTPTGKSTLILSEDMLKLKVLELEKPLQYRTGHMIYDLPTDTMKWDEAIALLERNAWNN